VKFEKSFVDLLYLRRKELRMSQSELAEASGVSRNYISQIERGDIDNVSFGVFFKICAALKMSMSVTAASYAAQPPRAVDAAMPSAHLELHCPQCHTIIDVDIAQTPRP